ncbi:uncharacterized protein LOC125048324 [Penaeus chinensis]|uniref:uncharacterized protein LOC125048324 n=1 Tax=Penaeus chinensis TaxID=139456 RepID=UPI001FB68B45|nr:uncharacterized protein LOC125048324 [Penaeus chinensis]
MESLGQQWARLFDRGVHKCYGEGRDVRKMENEGYTQDYRNYRGTNLTSHTLKIWETNIDRRKKLSISGQQFGFMPGRSTTDTIFSLQATDEVQRKAERDELCVHSSRKGLR